VDALPIDPLLPGIVDAVRRTRRLVLEAPPGAGKTTRVPSALLDAGVAGGRDVVVLQPRRLAARMAARRVADERGERLGDGIGFQVRFDRVGGDRTRLWFVTEGVLARRLLVDPTLAGVGAVVLDEFHERHLAADVALAQLRRLQGGARPDLALVVMSATLDAEPVARYLDDAPRVRSEGRAFPVEVEHADRRDDRPLETQVAAALGRLCDAGLAGDVLVFLPGAAEIRRCADAVRGLASHHGLLVLPLHGDLPAEEQDRAVRRADRRKVVLATNVAETSVTIDGVVAVIDTGLARIASFAPWSGLPTLRTEPVARAALAQRAGRAGRTRPGRCVRLFTRADHDARPAFERPEIARLDLAETVLELRAAGDDPATFPWFERPPEGALAAADALLARLGAVGADGRVDDRGRRMLRFPLHPRLSRFLVEAEDRGVSEEGAIVAALLAERDVRRSHRPSGLGGGFGGRGRVAASRDVDAGHSDLLARLDAFDEAAALRFQPGPCADRGLDAGAARAADRVRAQLEGLVRRRASRPAPASAADLEAALSACALVAFPDRVAKRRRPGGPELVLAGGGTATLAEESVVRDAPFVVAVDAEERLRGDPLVRTAVAVEPEALVEAFPDRVRDEVVARFVAEGERVEAVRRTVYDGLALEEARVAASSAPEAAAVLAAEARRAGARAFADAGALDTLFARAAFAAVHAPGVGLAALDEAAAERAIEGLCGGRASFRELREADLPGALLAALPPGARASLEALAPERLRLHGGFAPRVAYAAGRPPWIEAPLQDFFGQTDGPRVAGGKVAVTLHLLAPNRRPVQVTTDLAGFWDRHYAAVRRELSRRYPRHAWPDDPRTAAPPTRGPRRR